MALNEVTRLSNGKGTAILQSLLQEQSDYRWNVNEITHISNQLTSLRLFVQAKVSSNIQTEQCDYS